MGLLLGAAVVVAAAAVAYWVLRPQPKASAPGLTPSSPPAKAIPGAEKPKVPPIHDRVTSLASPRALQALADHHRPPEAPGEPVSPQARSTDPAPEAVGGDPHSRPTSVLPAFGEAAELAPTERPTASAVPSIQTGPQPAVLEVDGKPTAPVVPAVGIPGTGPAAAIDPDSRATRPEATAVQAAGARPEKATAKLGADVQHALRYLPEGWNPDAGLLQSLTGKKPTEASSPSPAPAQAEPAVAQVGQRRGK
jgi:hypothetical protein